MTDQTDRASIVAFLRREYENGPWKGTTVFLILADAIEREVDREKIDYAGLFHD